MPHAERAGGLAGPHRAAPAGAGGAALGRSGLGGARATRRDDAGRAVLGRAGRGGRTATITLSRVDGEGLVDVERWGSRDELGYALEAPVWHRFGSFAGQPHIRGEVIWAAEDRSAVMVGRHGDRPFEEIVA